MAAFLLAVLPFIVVPGDTTHRIEEKPMRAPSFRAAPAIVLMTLQVPSQGPHSGEADAIDHSSRLAGRNHA